MNRFYYALSFFLLFFLLLLLLPLDVIWMLYKYLCVYTFGLTSDGITSTEIYFPSFFPLTDQFRITDYSFLTLQWHHYILLCLIYGGKLLGPSLVTLDSSFSLQVAWMHFEQSAILTVHNHVITRNPRISVTHDKHDKYKTWFLHIANVQEEDKGRYM